MWRVVARSACSGTRSSGTRPTRGLSKRERGRLVRALAEREHVGPDGRLVRVARGTLDQWIRAYRHGGFEALVPQPRVVPLRTPAGMLELAFAVEAGAAGADRGAGPGDHARDRRRRVTMCRGCGRCRRTSRAQGLNVRADGRSPGKVYGRFEAGARNELWTGDGLHGPKLAGAAARRAVLLAFIDDHCRLLVGWRWGTGEDVFRLEAALRSGLMSRGVPDAILVDRGSAFVSSQLLRACAVLGREAGSREPARGDDEGQDRAVFQDRPRSVPGRDRRRYRARGAEPPVLRVVGGRLPPTRALRDGGRPRSPGSTPPARPRYRPRRCCEKRSCGRSSGR